MKIAQEYYNMGEYELSDLYRNYTLKLLRNKKRKKQLNDFLKYFKINRIVKPIRDLLFGYVPEGYDPVREERYYREITKPKLIELQAKYYRDVSIYQFERVE